MKIQGIINHEGIQIPVDEITMDQLIFQHKDGKTQLAITTLIDGKPMTFREDQIESLKVIQITHFDKEDELVIDK